VSYGSTVLSAVRKCQGRHVDRMECVRCVGRVCALFMALLFLSTAQAFTLPVTVSDPIGDTRLIRTDQDGDGFIDPLVQRLPDIVEMRIGSFAPTTPWTDRFDGVWDSGGGFVRFDLVLQGLVNPPGFLNFDSNFPVYDPFAFGPNPIFGFIEFDMDADEDTGGELNVPNYRYLGLAARWGGLPTESRFSGRAAQSYAAFDGDFQTAPFVERSGEEFHIPFLGEEMESITVIQEAPGGSSGIFEAGEIWNVKGHYFHRAHGFEDFAVMCTSGRAARYEPDVYLRFEHDIASDQTTISLVYPLHNSDDALLVGPNEPVEPNNGCSSDQDSVEEALFDLWFSAWAADSVTRLIPEFQLIAGWEFNFPVSQHLDSTAWRLATALGTAYASQEPGDNARFIWTDLWPDVMNRDVNGDDQVDAADTVALNAFIVQNDGVAGVDGDGDGSNGSIDLVNYADNFSLFDANYDGFVDGADGVLRGDMDLNQIVDLNDLDDFALALVDPAAYIALHPTADPVAQGDMNGDGLLDGADIAGFVQVLLGP